jgi:hypothetical protein
MIQIFKHFEPPAERSWGRRKMLSEKLSLIQACVQAANFAILSNHLHRLDHQALGSEDADQHKPVVSSFEVLVVLLAGSIIYQSQNCF